MTGKGRTYEAGGCRAGPRPIEAGTALRVGTRTAGPFLRLGGTHKELPSWALRLIRAFEAVCGAAAQPSSILVRIAFDVSTRVAFEVVCGAAARPSSILVSRAIGVSTRVTFEAVCGQLKATTAAASILVRIALRVCARVALVAVGSTATAA